jgi:hypothetical protein
VLGGGTTVESEISRRRCHGGWRPTDVVDPDASAPDHLQALGALDPSAVSFVAERMTIAS